MSKKKMSSGSNGSNAALAAKGKSLVTQVATTLAAGAPLSVKGRKEVLVRTIRISPAFVSAAASAYAEHADVLGGDLDPDAALAAQDFVVQMTPVATDLRTLTQAFEDRVREHKATAAEFGQTVYDRMRGLQSMPQGPALASRLAQLQALAVKSKGKSKSSSSARPAKAKAKATPAATADSAAPTEEATVTPAQPPATPAEK